MQVDSAIKAEVGIVELINSGEGRGNVLQLRSYAAPESEKFPAIFFQGPTDATDTSALVGKTVTGKLFVQVGSSQPVWYCGDQQTVSCTFDSVEKTELVGKFTAGNLTSTDGRTSTISGSFRVVSGGSSSSSAGSSSGGTP